MRYLRHLLPILIAILAALYFSFVFPLRDPHPRIVLPDTTLAIRDVRVYPTPDSGAIEHANVVVRNGVIVGVGADLAIPQNTQILECPNCTVTAGFWNCHVHFTETKWDFSAYKTADTLNQQLADMLTSRGFTTVADLGSDIRQTVSLRRRIEAGDLKGPAIYTAGSGIYPPHGIPFYLASMPLFLRWLMPQPETPQAAEGIVESNIARGADILKLFTGSLIKPGEVLPMPVEIATAAVNAAHRHGQIAFAHPSDLAGTKVAVDSGVDVLAHAPSVPAGIDDALLQSIVAHHMSMMPTLKMFATTASTSPKFLDPIYDIVRRYHALGGDLMFGTDVGYMEDYSTEDEFQALAKSGLNSRDILRMLTAAPAARFKVDAQRGAVTPGKMADLVVLDGDPVPDVAVFARVHFTVRNGCVIYERSK
jgi:imidazolonepropionase-like amidohydrolase